MTKTNILYLFLALAVVSCNQTTYTSASTQQTKRKSSKRQPLPALKHYVDKNADGNYEPIVLEDKPVPVQGREQWTRDFYGSIRYPALARENGIQGIVVLSVMVDEFGKVTDVGVLKGISKECDAETTRAFVASTRQGYNPLVIDGASVRFKFEIAVGFWLE